MTRRLPPALRTWSGALLVCALMFCLTGLARSAMAMPMAMTGPMGAVSATVGSDAPAGHVVMASDFSDSGPECPTSRQVCEAPKGTVVNDGPTAPVLDAAPDTATCPPAALVSQPNTPPRVLPPPDLHRLCVSRT
ncbi:hypothetical protein [Streptomyces sp. H27-S2]|uniref:hypothetical protein n=1 Tax=Streptomyces antarcticus TaxID=2996458 RepID=UPI00226E760A|nr:hypothetical protein [Streptomyces sp. H27-S2]MCY0950665.1 hypothetical protein [Streptomyces sp. H27-S2]